jgi:hypothetical protein
VFLALYLPEPTSDAALIFYGASMLLAALRGYAGCEVLAVSNWRLRRVLAHRPAGASVNRLPGVWSGVSSGRKHGSA